jgi:hypothetical protein
VLSFSAALLLLLLPALLGLGMVGAHWAHCPLRAAHGRWLYAVVAVFVALLALVVASTLRHNFLFFGLALAAIFMAMLWDAPARRAATDP